MADIKISNINNILHIADLTSSTFPYVQDLAIKDINSNYISDVKYGYAAAGNTHNSVGPVSTTYSTIERFVFPFDAGIAYIQGSTSVSSFYSTGCNSSIYGYSSGYNNGGNIVDRVQFPLDSGNATQVGVLSPSISVSLRGSMNSSNHGFWCGGSISGIEHSIIDRILFPFDSTVATSRGVLSISRWSPGGTNSSVNGYIIAGTNDVTPRSTIDKIVFPFDAGDATSSGVGANVWATAYFANHNSSLHGYNVVGSTASTYIVFSFDSATASSGGTLSLNKSHFKGCNSTTHGYTLGYLSTNSYSAIDRVTYSWTTGSAVVVGSLATSKYNYATYESGLFFW